MNSVKKIESSFRGLEIPEEWRQHYKCEIATLKAQEARHGGKMPNNNQTYASVGNLRKLYKKCKDG